MSFNYYSPAWFFGYDVAFELFFVVITLFVAFFAFKIYKATGQKSSKLLGSAFIFVSISYLIQSIFNFLTISRLNENICRAIKIQSILLFDTFGVYAHMLFMTIGLVILAYMTFKLENKKVLWLLLLVSLLGMFLSKNALHIFFLFSSIYLLFISAYFVKNYLTRKKTQTLLIAIAFLFLLFGSIHFLFAVNHQLFYVIGHALELLAYILILINLYLVRKK